MENLCDEELLEILNRHHFVAKKYRYKHPDWIEAWKVIRIRILNRLNP